jgi:hypothetical protein
MITNLQNDQLADIIGASQAIEAYNSIKRAKIDSFVAESCESLVAYFYKMFDKLDEIDCSVMAEFETVSKDPFRVPSNFRVATIHNVVDLGEYVQIFWSYVVEGEYIPSFVILKQLLNSSDSDIEKYIESILEK